MAIIVFETIMDEMPRSCAECDLAKNKTCTMGLTAKQDRVITRYHNQRVDECPLFELKHR